MIVSKCVSGGNTIAVVQSQEEIIKDAQSVLDFLMTVNFETDCNRIALNKDAIAEKFFVLSSGIAGDVLQKCANYKMKFAVYGDFSGYTSKPLRDLFYECNKGNDIFFVETEKEAVTRLGLAR